MQLKRTSVFMILIVTLFMSSQVQAAKPTVKMMASPAMITVGGSSTLTWISTGATSASINSGIGTVAVNGSVVVAPSKTTSYTITVRNSSGSATSRVTVTVKAALPTVTFSASPDSILSGQSSILSWTTANATSASINQGIGTVSLNGSRTVAPVATTTYTITVKGSRGTVTAAATVTVTTAPPPIASLTANPVSIYRGQSSTLTWTSENATSLSINNGVGSVNPNGSVAVSPTLTTIYTLTATGPGGTTTDGAQVQVSVYPAPTAALTANPQSIQPGESATLNWATANADSVTLDNGIGAVELNGSMTVSPAATTAYTLIATGFGGTKTVSTFVIVSKGRKCYAFIPDSTDKTVRIVDTDTNVLFKTITVSGTGSSLQGVAAEESGVYVYVADAGLTSLLRIDPLTMTICDTLALDGNFQGKPKHVAVAQDGCHVYTTSSAPFWDPAIGKYVGDICSIKTSGNGISSIRLVEVEIPGRVTLEGLAVSGDGSRLFVADPDNGRILVLDTMKLHRLYANPIMLSDELVATIPLSLPKELAVTPDGQKLYATSSGYLHEIDAAQFTVRRSLAVSGAQFLKVSPDGSRVYLMSGNALITVETAGLTKLSTVAVTGMGTCSGFDVHPDGTRLFMVDSYGKKLFMVNAADSQVISTLGLGSAPVAVGRFISPLPVTVTGNVRQDGSPLSDVTMTLSGEGILRSKLTPAAGDFIFALKPGNYSLTPTLSNLAFSPEKMDLQVSRSQTGLDFAVSGVVPPPTVTLVASKTWVKQFETFTLTWESTGADYVTLELLTSDHLPPSGSRNDSLAYTSTINAKAYSRGGTASASVMIVVSSGNPPTATISANPASILQGGSSTLTWNVTGVSTVTIDNGIGAVAASGSKVVSPAATTAYTVAGTRSDGYQITASTKVTVSEFDTSAKLTGTVTDFATSQPLNEVLVSASDASGVPHTASTDVTGKYTMSNLRIGSINVSFAKTGYDSYQQIINIPANTTFDLTTQLHQALIGATLRGLVKDGQTNLPIVGATVIAAYSGSSQTSTSAADGSYILTNIPLGTSATITACYTGYQSKTIQQTFSQAQVYVWDFAIYDESVVTIINGKITNAKTLLPEAGVKVTHEGSNISKITAADGIFVFDNIPFGEQTFYFEKPDFIEETITSTVDRTPFTIDLIKPSSEEGQITIGQNISGIIQDAISQLPIAGAKVRVPGLNLEVVSDTNGNYSLTDLPIGNYPIVIMAVEHAAMKIIATVDNGESNTADFPLYPLTRGLIKGSITDSKSGEPVPQASIEVDGNVFLSATSEGDGTYKLVGIPPGTCKLKISHAEYAENFIENVEIQDMSPTTIDMQLNRRPQTGALEGKILDISTNKPVSGALVAVLGTSITSITDVNGSYRLTNVPAGLNNITILATGYPSALRIRAVSADESASSPTTTSSNIHIDSNSSTVDEKVTKLIKANEGGDITTIDNRFSLHIFPGTLSADANISLNEVTDGPNIVIGSDLPLDPNLGLSGIKGSSIMTQIEIAPVVQTDPVPTINGLVVIAARYSQKDVGDFQLDESTAFPYSWNESFFTALNPRPYEHAVDKVNNIAYAAVDISTTTSGSSSQFSQHTLLKSDSVHSGSVLAIPWAVKKFIVGKALKASIFPPKPNIKIFDKTELDCVTNACSDQKPNPNALPLIFIHGFDPMSTFNEFVTNPNNEERYKTMLEDLIAATNGVYRPVFVSYNTEAKIASVGKALAEKLYGEYLNKNNSIKGLPADSSDPDSGTFPYVDTFGFSMGGLVSRVFAYGNPKSRVHNMVMIGTPNHGTFICLRYLKDTIKYLNVGASDQIDYDDSTLEGLLQNPFLFWLNSPKTAPFISPQGDMSLFAGTDERAWKGLFGAFLQSPHDSFVPVRSAFCRPTSAILESGLSLLKVQGSNAKKFEHTEDFSHDNVGSKLKQKQIATFITNITRGLSDWIAEREYNENGLENVFLKPTKDNPGYAKSKVKVEYNVWDGSDNRSARDIDRVVLVIYHKDGNDHWHISESNGGENGADSNGYVIDAKVLSINGNSNRLSTFDKILNATVNFDSNPEKDASGYDPEKDIVEIVPLVIALKPGKMIVPLDPTKVNFRVPKTDE